ncbi:hypothetical protein ACE01N_04685 [Saccharicrinis sp. FJH2]|uniref:hypothetical protein n=1 Tax=Saccharicrinis sp. FJH65 TaxID=3344659 RepID=UPI0035F32FE2
MKKAIFILALLILTVVSHGQNIKENSYDIIQNIQLKPNTVAKFFEIDNRGNLQTDTIFIASEYFIFKPFYEENINGKDYVIIKFPNFSGNSNSGKMSKHTPAIGGVAKGTVRVELSEAYNGKILAISKEDFDKLLTNNIYKRNIHITGGILTLPFKFRGKVGEIPRSMTTDVTLGPYVGPRMRLSRKSDFFVTMPFTLGLTFINVNNSNTSPTNPSNNQNEIVPGLTLGSGLVFQIRQYEFGLIGGWDFGTGTAGSEWIYNEKPWISFAIGYSFLK